MPEIKLINISFGNQLSQSELPYFRGAMIKFMENSELSHNHTETGVKYRYPLIQYKIIDNRPTIIAINEAVEISTRIISRCDYKCNIGNRPIELKDIRIKGKIEKIETTSEKVEYTIKQMIIDPNTLMNKFFEEMQATLEAQILGHILSFCKGIGIWIEDSLTVKLKKIENENRVSFKNTHLYVMDASFQTNITLPETIGLGKSTSLGFGTIYKNL